MSPGRLIAVVGPSGVGKDSLIVAIVAACPGLCRARRVITRQPDAGGEDFEAIREAEFARRRAAGDFVLWWAAHGLHYGIPAATRQVLAGGRDVIANLSRGVLADAQMAFPRLHVLSLTAPPEVLAQRLGARGREDAAGRARRLSRSAPPMPPGLAVTEIDNGGALSDSVAAAIAALYPDADAAR